MNTLQKKELQSSIASYSDSNLVQLEPEPEETQPLISSGVAEAERQRRLESGLRTGAGLAVSAATSFAPPGVSDAVNAARAARNVYNTLEVRSRIQDDIAAATGDESAHLMNHLAQEDVSDEQVDVLRGAARLTAHKAIAQGITAVVPGAIVNKLRSADEKQQAVEAATAIVRDSTYSSLPATILKGKSKIEKFQAYLNTNKENMAIKYLAKHLIGVATSAEMPEPDSIQFDYGDS